MRSDRAAALARSDPAARRCPTPRRRRPSPLDASPGSLAVVVGNDHRRIFEPLRDIDTAEISVENARSLHWVLALPVERARSTADRVGSDGTTSAIVTHSAAARHANRAAATASTPRATSTAYAALKVSPAPVVSTTSGTVHAVMTVISSPLRTSAPSPPSVSTTTGTRPNCGLAIRSIGSSSTLPPLSRAASPRFGMR